MANKKISQLDRVSTHTADDLVPVVNDGFTQKTTLYDLDRFFLGDNCDNHIMVSGKLIAGCENTGQNGDYHNILGGRHNRIYGSYSTILGGENNYVQGEYNLAYGYNINITSGNGQVIFADSLTNEVPGFGDATMTLNFQSGVHVRMGDLYVHEMMGKAAIQTNDKYLAYNVEEGIIYTIDTDLAASGGGGGTPGPTGPSGTSGTGGTSGTSGTSGFSGTSGTSGVDGSPGPPGSDGAADLSALSPGQVIYVGGTEGNETFAGSDDFQFGPSDGDGTGLILDNVAFKKATQVNDVGNNVNDIPTTEGDKLDIDASATDFYFFNYNTTMSDSNLATEIHLNITNLEDGQTFQLVACGDSSTTGNAAAFKLYFDGVVIQNLQMSKIGGDNTNSELFLRKRSRVLNQDMGGSISVVSPAGSINNVSPELFPADLQGGTMHVFVFTKQPLNSTIKLITWTYDEYGGGLDPQNTSSTAYASNAGIQIPNA